MPHWTRIVLLALVGGVVCACSHGSHPGAPTPAGQATIRVSSPAFGEGDLIPAQFTCDGEETSPPLTWSGVPESAEALALVVDDPDAPGGPFVHWVVVDIPVDVDGVPSGTVPAGSVQALSSTGGIGYAGPCPPDGVHRYRFTVYALARPTGLEPGAAADAGLSAIEDAAIAWGRLTARYGREFNRVTGERGSRRG